MCQWWIMNYVSTSELLCDSITHMWLCCLLPSLLVSQSHFLPLKMRETEHKRVIDSLCCETLHIGAFSPTRIVRVVTDKLQETQSSALSKNNCRQWSLLEKVSWHDLLQAPTVCLCLYPDWQARDWGKTFYFHGLVLPCRNEEKHVGVENESDVSEWFSSLSFFSPLLVIAA